MIKFLNWVAGLRPTPCNKRVPFEPDPPGPASFSPKPPPDVAAVINRRLDRGIAACPALRRGSNPPALGSKLEPPSQPPELDRERFWPASQCHQILAIAEGMKARADMQSTDAVILRHIVESLDGFVAAEQGGIPATTDSGQILVTPPKPQPTGGRLIRGDVDPGPTPSPLLRAIRCAIDNEPFGDEPRAVLLVVAKWLRSAGIHFAAARLELEAGR